ncbi:MAG TPA: hypothetical protein VE641_14440, partial [Chthoniobacterales bacterium]|nr:hypothetical protein [Chthoniobacterales bacterium]
GATVLGGLIWSALVASGGATNALLTAGVLFSITTLLTTGYGLMKRFAGPSAKISAVLPAKNFSGNKTEVNRPETPGAEILSNRMKPVIG